MESWQSSAVARSSFGVGSSLDCTARASLAVLFGVVFCVFFFFFFFFTGRLSRGSVRNDRRLAARRCRFVPRAYTVLGELP